jgi:hypothetical protein
MLSPEKVRAALEAKKDRFADFDVQTQQESDRYRAAFDALAQQSKAQIEAGLQGKDYPGARPTAEHDTGSGLVVPFGQTWNNHEEARAWAMSILRGVPTLAVDGSQIQAQRDVSIPVAVVQVGWFFNPHDPDQSYEKNIHVEVLAPDEFAEEDVGEGGFPDTEVNARRFLLEVETIISFMQRYQEAAVKPLCFLDGSLVLSFAAPTRMPPTLAQRYRDSICRLLATSEACQVPLVGYIDRSYAKDLVTMVATVTRMPLPTHLSDAPLVRLPAWGDRSQVYVCARDDGVLKHYRDPDSGRNLSDQVCFVYLQTTSDTPPARLDVPRWMVENGELERVLNLVRAECLIATGYPYALETADAVAVLTMQDRERFNRLFQDFLAQQGKELRITRKSLSKRRRR